MVSPSQLELQNAVWIDANTQYTQNTLPDRLPDDLAIIRCSLFNLFNCQVGQRGRTFQPEYGSNLMMYLQEPISERTARSINLAIIQAVARWEPRVSLDYGLSFVKPNPQLPGYDVRLAFTMPTASQNIKQVEFQLNK